MCGTGPAGEDGPGSARLWPRGPDDVLTRHQTQSSSKKWLQGRDAQRVTGRRGSQTAERGHGAQRGLTLRPWAWGSRHPMVIKPPNNGILAHTRVLPPSQTSHTPSTLGHRRVQGGRGHVRTDHQQPPHPDPGAAAGGLTLALNSSSATRCSGLAGPSASYSAFLSLHYLTANATALPSWAGQQGSDDFLHPL